MFLNTQLESTGQKKKKIPKKRPKNLKIGPKSHGNVKNSNITQTIDLKCKLRLGINVFKHSYGVSVIRKFEKSPEYGQKNLKIGPKSY